MSLCSNINTSVTTCNANAVIDTRASVILQCVRYASKKSAGSTKNKRNTPGKRLGLKCGDGKS